MTWTYQVVSDQSATRNLVITNLPARTVNGLSLVPRKFESGGMTKYYLMGTDDRGVYRYGEQASETAEPVAAKARVYELHAPVAEGTTWDIQTRLGEDELTVNLTIESVNDEITVPAGSFKDCVKVRHKGGSQKEGAGVSLEAYEWYAPKVGLVKSVVTITRVGKDQKKIAEHQTYQLESFKS
jgi:hypothetical protein